MSYINLMTFFVSNTFYQILVSERCACVVLVILLLGEIMPIYSCCLKKKLVYIIITAFFSCQPSFYSKGTKANTCSLCNVCLVSINKCIFRF